VTASVQEHDADDCENNGPIMASGSVCVNEPWRYGKNGITDMRVETIGCGAHLETGGSGRLY
jgi:hypothetical protein